MTPRWRNWFRRTAFFALSSTALLATNMRAAEPPNEHPSPLLSATVLRDLQLTVHVRKALTADEVLAPLNIGVRVDKGVAILWGPAPSAAAALRAIRTARTVAGLDDVRSEMRIAPVQELAVTPLPPAPLKDVPKPTTAVPGWLTGRESNEPASASANGEPNGVRLRLPQLGGEALRLTPPSAQDTFLGSLARLKQADERFRPLNATLHEDTAIVTGTVTRARDLLDFEQHLLALPGVRHVQTDAVQLLPATSHIGRAVPTDLRIGR
jgi:hypothetical protein